MYLLEIHYENAKYNKTGKLVINYSKGNIRKWNILPPGRASKELFQLIALSVTDTNFFPYVPHTPKRMFYDDKEPLHMEVVIARNPETEGKGLISEFRGSGVEILSDGSVKRLASRECRYLSFGIDIRTMYHTTSLNKYLLLAYGPELKSHDKTDDFDFNNPFIRVTRFHSIFNKNARLTDPVAFLKTLHYRGIKYKRHPPRNMLRTICSLFHDWLEIDTSMWMEKHCNYQQEWAKLGGWQKRPILPLLDICRHLLDAFPRKPYPLNMPGVVLLNRPDLLCTPKRLTLWLTLMDLLLPRMQILLTLSKKTASDFPKELSRSRLELPNIKSDSSRHQKPTKLPSRFILLIDVDGRLPNLALMKLSRHYKEQGRKIVLARNSSCIKGADTVFASCIFNSQSSKKIVAKLKKFYGKSLVLGGSGIDVHMRLAPQINTLPPDYDLYPDLGDRALGFITRGCTNNCPFCIVPVKEGKPRKVSELDTLLQNGRKKLILLDDNILSHPDAGDFLEEMASRDLQVNFTQTLDIRLLNKELAGILGRIHCANTRFTRRNYHFSLNNNKNLQLIARKYHLLGFTSRDNAEFVCMYGFNTTLAEDVERFRFLRSLPGAYVFVQKYQPILGGPPPILTDFFDDRADELIDELIRIVFTQNMRNVENYYRWISQKYAQTFGKLHTNLVDTIFKYNDRHRKGKYIATLAGTRKFF